jgi:septal ring factor EnvC (AmiA/AmiB activator)
MLSQGVPTLVPEYADGKMWVLESTQAQRNVELHKAQRAAEKEAHDLNIALKESKDNCDQLRQRIEALTAKNSSIADRLQDVEGDLENVTRDADKLAKEVSFPSCCATAHVCLCLVFSAKCCSPSAKAHGRRRQI